MLNSILIALCLIISTFCFNSLSAASLKYETGNLKFEKELELTVPVKMLILKQCKKNKSIESKYSLACAWPALNEVFFNQLKQASSIYPSTSLIELYSQWLQDVEFNPTLKIQKRRMMFGLYLSLLKKSACQRELLQLLSAEGQYWPVLYDEKFSIGIDLIETLQASYYRLVWSHASNQILGQIFSQKFGQIDLDVQNLEPALLKIFENNLVFESFAERLGPDAPSDFGMSAQSSALLSLFGTSTSRYPAMFPIELLASPDNFERVTESSKRVMDFSKFIITSSLSMLSDSELNQDYCNTGKITNAKAAMTICLQQYLDSYQKLFWFRWTDHPIPRVTTTLEEFNYSDKTLTPKDRFLDALATQFFIIEESIRLSDDFLLSDKNLSGAKANGSVQDEIEAEHLIAQLLRYLKNNLNIKNRAELNLWSKQKYETAGDIALTPDIHNLLKLKGIL